MDDLAARLTERLRRRDEKIAALEACIEELEQGLQVTCEREAATTARYDTRIEALETALAIDDATVTLQQQEMIKNRNAIGRAIDFINADLPIEALSTLRAAYRESDT